MYLAPFSVGAAIAVTVANKGFPSSSVWASWS
jgi:hypothetical protein